MNMAQGGRGSDLRALSNSDVASRLGAAVADVSLILDDQGVVVEASVGDSVEAHPGWDALVGKRWIDTLAKDSQRKVDQLLREARKGEVPRARELNQKVEGLGEVPLRFNALLLDDAGRVLALGRDLRPIANLQQRMIAAQQIMDVEYARVRQADTRYRVLFHVSSEGVVVAEAASRRVVEVNPSAATMLGELAPALQGKPLQSLFEADSWEPVLALLAAAEAGARPVEAQARLRGAQGGAVTVSVSLFRQSGSAVVLIRLWSAQRAQTKLGERASRMLATLEAMPDAFVVAGEDRRVLCANNAFCDLVQNANENQVVGQPLDRWLGRPGVDLNIMFANLREHGIVRNFSTIIRGDFGPPQEGLVTAVSALDGNQPCLGFSIRAVSSRLTEAPVSSVMPRSIEQLRELVGRVSLKELVRESADLIERLCIEAALDVSGNNRASAAQLLGLSRQGLYSKLRRHGLAEFGPQ